MPWNHEIVTNLLLVLFGNDLQKIEMVSLKLMQQVIPIISKQMETYSTDHFSARSKLAEILNFNLVKDTVE